jgi:hypothetical protein
MPLPIWPEPITPTFLIITAISSSHRNDTPSAARPSASTPEEYGSSVKALLPENTFCPWLRLFLS